MLIVEEISFFSFVDRLQRHCNYRSLQYKNIAWMLMGRDSFVVGKVVSIISSRWSPPKFAIIAATTILDAAKRRKFLDLDSVEVRSRDRIFMSRPKNAPYCLFYTTKRTFYREILLPDTRDIFCERVGNGKKEREKKSKRGEKSDPPSVESI